MATGVNYHKLQPPRRRKLVDKCLALSDTNAYPIPLARGRIAMKHPRPMNDARSWRWAAVLCVLAAASATLPTRGAEPESAAPSAAGLELFERDVRPIFVDVCGKCHSPRHQDGSLRLDSREALVQGGDRGAAIVPGNPAKSLLVEAVRHSDDLQMPPKGKLTDAQIASIERWIELGAPWPKSATPPKPADDPAKTHWAFQPIQDPPVPTADAASPPANPIDAFIGARLHEAGLSPAEKADRRTLIRRVYYDLLGLPPTHAEVEAFVADSDPQAYEKLIDRLLASEHYGEQWGRHWLDVARYSDTKGYVYGREQRFWVHAWAYRDWVVKALNDDMPYDRFLLLQIAADQAAPDDRASQAAMGFLTIGRRFLGVTHDIIDDRIDVVTRGTMGLTVACARCHDHKYDPIPTRDYYSLYGVFQNCQEQLIPIGQPTGDEASQQAFQQELEKRETKLANLLAQRRQEASDRARARIADYLQAQLELHKYPEEGFDVVLAKDDVIPAFVRRWQAYLIEAKRTGDPIFVPWFSFAELKPEEFAQRAADVTRSLHEASERPVHPLVLGRFQTPPESMREVVERYAALFTDVSKQWQEALKQAKETNVEPPAELPDAASEQLRRVLYGPTAPCEVPDEGIVHLESFFDLGSCEELWRVQSERDNLLIQSPQAPPYALILTDRQHLRPAYVFRRGQPANKGDEAPRQFLELLAGPNRQPFAKGSGRLELAQAIIDPRNPLTARVAVNRVWLHHFGAGLVTTPSDFGVRAEPPSHPQLLDWLASRFIEDGWSLKKLHRRILLSEAYQRGSRGPADPAKLAKALEVDPQNRLLWRANVRRLSFEELRDSLLASTDELDRTLGGKPADLFAASFKRRTLYGRIDRQFLPGTLRVFDFANPDLHIPQRSETIVPQQALFFLNDPLLLNRAQAMVKRLPPDQPPEERIRQIFRSVYQRDPTADQLAAAVQLVSTETPEPAPISRTAADWQYGFGGYDEAAQRTTNFQKLPYFTGSAWQGGPDWPDAALGWVQLTARGGHAGNDLQHAAVRRWTAPKAMRIQIRSTLAHDTSAGDGVRGRIVSSRGGELGVEKVHNRRAELNVDQLDVEAGETIDFALDIGGTLNNDQFEWEVTIRPLGDEPPVSEWNSVADFQVETEKLDPWAQLVQVLLSANEFSFVD